MGLVPFGLLDRTGGEEAVETSAGTVEAATEARELVQVLLGGLEGVALKPDETIEPPEVESDAVGKNELEVVDGLESGDLAGKMVFPVGLLLDFGEDRVS